MLLFECPLTAPSQRVDSYSDRSPIRNPRAYAREHKAINKQIIAEFRRASRFAGKEIYVHVWPTCEINTYLRV